MLYNFITGHVRGKVIFFSFSVQGSPYSMMHYEYIHDVMGHRPPPFGMDQPGIEAL